MISSKSRVQSAAILWIIIVSGAILFIYQWISFSNTRLNLENALSETQKQKEILKSDLTALQKKITKQEQVIVSVSQERDRILAALYQEKQRAYVEAQSLRAKVAKLQASINQAINVLQSENDRLGKELTSAKEELRLWEGQIRVLNEKELVLKKVSLTKKRLAQRIKAIIDASRKIMCYTPLTVGNSGYLIRDGKSTLNANAAVELEKIIVKKTAKDSPAALSK